MTNYHDVKLTNMAKTFGDTPEQKARKEREKRCGRLMELIQADYQTFNIQVKANHPQYDATLGRLIDELSEYRSLSGPY
jgi:hypothetical protein